MCGIFGFYSVEALDDPSGILRKGLRRIVHRGPDEEGVFESGKFFMGMRRLSIIDLSGGSQPFYNEDGSIAVVFNGELYNYKAIRADLVRKGHVFHSNSDTEVIAHLYEEYGPGFPEKLNGMFAIALFCRNTERLLIFRDRFGIKPLHYLIDESAGRFAFASELKSFEALPFFRKEISPEGISAYLQLGHIPAPWSIYQKVSKLKSSHYLEIDLKNFRVVTGRYFDLDTSRKARPGEPARVAFELLKDAVSIRTISDVPIGVFLSGGIDSSAIVAMLHLSGFRDINTFSVSFKGEGLYDESRFARSVAEKFNTRHHEIEIKLEYSELLEKFFHYFDEPFSDSSAIPTLAISAEAARQVKVVLSGTGGDEVFLGYRRYLLARFLKYIPALGRCPVSGFLRSLIEKLLAGKVLDRSSALNSRLLYLLRMMSFTGRDASERYLENMSGLSVQQFEALRQETGPEYGRLLDLNFKGDYFPSAFDVSVYLESDLLVKEDRATMANSLESRVPFLDHRLVDAMYHVDESLKIRGNSLKYILKKMLRGLLPDYILDRPKQGFAVPVSRILECGPVNPVYRKILDPGADLLIHGFADRKTISGLIHRGVMTDDTMNFIWRLAVLEKFLVQT